MLDAADEGAENAGPMDWCDAGLKLLLGDDDAMQKNAVALSQDKVVNPAKVVLTKRGSTPVKVCLEVVEFTKVEKTVIGAEKQDG